MEKFSVLDLNSRELLGKLQEKASYADPKMRSSTLSPAQPLIGNMITSKKESNCYNNKPS